MALFELLIIGLLMLWSVKVFADRRLTMAIPSIVWPLLGLLGLGLAQSLAVNNSSGQMQSLSMDVEATRLVALLLFCLVAAGVIAANFLAGRERLHLLLNSLVIFGFVLAVFGLIQHFSWNGKIYWLRPINAYASAPFGPFVNHNHFAGYMEMLLPLPVALIVTGAARAEARLFYAFAAMTMGIATVVSLSRGGIISLLAEMMFILAMSFRLSKRRKAGSQHALSNLAGIGAVVVIIMAIIAGVFWIGADSVVNRVTQGQLTGDEQGTETFYSSRGWIWQDTLKMISARPVLGAGLGAYQTAYPGFSEHDKGLVVDKAHNDYLQLLAESGIVGGLLALWFAFLVFRGVARGLRSRDPWPVALALGSGAAMVAMLVHSFFDFNLQLPANSLLFLLLSATTARVGEVAEAAHVSVKAADPALEVRSRAADLATGVSS